MVRQSRWMTLQSIRACAKIILINSTPHTHLDQHNRYKALSSSQILSSRYLISFFQAIAAGEPSLILTVFGALNSGVRSVPIAHTDSVFGLEKLPAGWTKPQTPVTQQLILATGAEIASKWQLDHAKSTGK
jgi:hypothetical protein